MSIFLILTQATLLMALVCFSVHVYNVITDVDSSNFQRPVSSLAGNRLKSNIEKLLVDRLQNVMLTLCPDAPSICSADCSRMDRQLTMEASWTGRSISPESHHSSRPPTYLASLIVHMKLLRSYDSCIQTGALTVCDFH